MMLMDSVINYCVLNDCITSINNFFKKMHAKPIFVNNKKLQKKFAEMSYLTLSCCVEY